MRPLNWTLGMRALAQASVIVALISLAGTIRGAEPFRPKSPLETV